MNNLRRYTTPAVVTLFIFLLAASALAVAGDVIGPNAKSSDKAKEATAKEHDEEDSEAQGEGAETVNHGHCVSYWAHAAKAAGLKGKAKGEFISTVAQDEDATSVKLEGDATPTGDCGGYQAVLDSAVADQGQTTSHGKSGEEHGRSDENGKPSTAGKSAGKGKASERKPDDGS